VTVYRGDRIGIIGPNGAGKTTLLKMIAGELAPNAGEIRYGHNVKPGYYAQHHAELLHPKNTVLQEVASTNKELGQTRVRSVLGAFLFSGDDVDKPIGVLSGGERARVALARLLVDPGNLLLLDEPTNHLDLDSCESLVESMAGYEGTMVFVSHNRALIRRLATKIWVVEGGVVTEYHGNLDDYMQQERVRLAELAKGESKAGEGPRVAPRAPGTTGAKAVAPGPKPAGAASPSVAPPPPDAARSREDDKARKREEAKRREERSKKIGPLKKKVEELEKRIAELEAKQKERNDQLCDPSVQLADKERFAMLDALQSDQAKIDELTERWGSTQEELEKAERELAG
jgi:ATP-binding cassette subfamily F protein 3